MSRKKASARCFCALRRSFRGATQLGPPGGKPSFHHVPLIRAALITGASPVASYSLLFGAPSGVHSHPPYAPPFHYRRLPVPYCGGATTLPRRFEMRILFPGISVNTGNVFPLYSRSEAFPGFFPVLRSSPAGIPDDKFRIISPDMRSRSPPRSVRR